MGQTKKSISRNERQAAHTLMFVLILGWLAVAVEILIMRSYGDWSLTAFLPATLVAGVVMILLLISMGATLLGLVLVFQRRDARGLGLALLILAAVPLVEQALHFDSTVRDSQELMARRKYGEAVKDRYPEIKALLEQPISVISVHEFGECAVIEINEGLGLVVDRRGADNELKPFEDLQRQVESSEIRVEVPSKYAFIPLETRIKKLTKAGTVTFACAVWLDDHYWRMGTCWP